MAISGSNRFTNTYAGYTNSANVKKTGKQRERVQQGGSRQERRAKDDCPILQKYECIKVKIISKI